jgi:quercetin dioxygenase-like cupin family protein
VLRFLSDQLDGFTLADVVVPARFGGPIPHAHHEFDEALYILDGTLVVTHGHEEVEAGPGAFFLAARGIRHAFRNPSDDQVRVLGLWSPGPAGLAFMEDRGGPPCPPPVRPTRPSWRRCTAATTATYFRDASRASPHRLIVVVNEPGSDATILSAIGTKLSPAVLRLGRVPGDLPVRHQRRDHVRVDSALDVGRAHRHVHHVLRDVDPAELGREAETASPAGLAPRAALPSRDCPQSSSPGRRPINGPPSSSYVHHYVRSSGRRSVSDW